MRKHVSILRYSRVVFKDWAHGCFEADLLSYVSNRQTHKLTKPHSSNLLWVPIRLTTPVWTKNSWWGLVGQLLSSYRLVVACFVSTCQRDVSSAMHSSSCLWGIPIWAMLPSSSSIYHLQSFGWLLYYFWGICFKNKILFGDIMWVLRLDTNVTSIVASMVPLETVIQSD